MMDLRLLRENPAEERKLKELDGKDTTLNKRKSYTLVDMLNNLDSINMGRAITTRSGSLSPIKKNIILSPYSSMYQIYSGNMLQDPNDKNMVTESRDDKVIRKRTMQRIGVIVREFVNVEYQHFANVLCGLTRSNMYRVIMDYKRECVQIAENRALSRDVDSDVLLYTRFGCQDRLYPLSTERYHKFARENYAKLKSPRFNKRFIDSVRFGGARIVSVEKKVNIRGPSFKKLCVVERHIGLRRFKFLNDHVGIAFEIDGGCFVLHERKKGKQQHLWLLRQYRTKGSPQVVQRKRDFVESMHATNILPIYYGPGSRRKSRAGTSSKIIKYKGETNE